MALPFLEWVLGYSLSLLRNNILDITSDLKAQWYEVKMIRWFIFYFSRLSCHSLQQKM